MEKRQAKNIRWGILGIGKIAQKFAEDLATVSNSELVAVASRSQEVADNFAERFHVKIALNSYEELAICKEIDAVYIATPHSFHKEHTILCLQHKKAVLCEKPFAMNLLEVQEMIAVAKENNVLLMEAMWTYFLPHYTYVLELLKNEKYGAIKTLEADFGFHSPFDENNRVFKKELGGGSLLDIGIYPIFVALSTLGIPEDIEADATFFNNGADATTEMTFHCEKSKAILKSSLLHDTPSEAIFTCEFGVVKINSRFNSPTSVTILENGHEETIHFECNTHGFNYEISHFNQLLRDHKKESDIMTFEFSENLIKTLDQVRTRINLIY